MDATTREPGDLPQTKTSTGGVPGRSRDGKRYDVACLRFLADNPSKHFGVKACVIFPVTVRRLNEDGR